MTTRRREWLYATAFAMLLVLHVWLLTRAVTRGDALLVVLLAAAVGVFVHRIAHHARRARGSGPRAAEDPEAERRRIGRWSVLIAVLLPLHLWLITQTFASDALITALLAVAVGMMIYRLAVFAARLAVLRPHAASAPSGKSP